MTIENCVEKQTWCMPDEEDTIYVNLMDNRENFTAYNGTDVWSIIYEENCL